MTINAVVITTFPNNAWDVYAKKMVASFVQNWPQDVKFLIELDDDLLAPDVNKILRPDDCVASGWMQDHRDFVEKHKDKDDPQDYRKQAVRFCHKIFAIKRLLDAVNQDGVENAPHYLIWLDADVITTAPVTEEMLTMCLPSEGDAVAYLGRKDWHHSECGWMAFDLKCGGGDLITKLFNEYANNRVHEYKEWHDSYIFDRICEVDEVRRTNLTEDKPGMDIWQHSPMAVFSAHYKGPQAKAKLMKQELAYDPGSRGNTNIRVKTRNSIPNEEICKNIEENQKQIVNWAMPCLPILPIDDAAVVVSAGPSLVAEDILEEVAAGRKIFAVKHALTKLKEAGITPYACLLLDPRGHVYDFVENPDTNVIYFVASQVQPKVVKNLLDRGCTVIGYHASVGANEGHLTSKQPLAVVHGGSASATRGLHLLEMLGYKNFRLYGYDLCHSEKPDMSLKDEFGQAKYFEMNIGFEGGDFKMKKTFWTEGQFIAQFEEISDIIKSEKWNIQAFGDGIVPFIIKAKRAFDLKISKSKDKLLKGVKLTTLDDLIGGFNCKLKMTGS